MMIVTNRYRIGNENLANHDQNLELKTENSTSTSTGLKVEIVAISSPVSIDGGYNHISNLNLLIKINSKKKCSLISHSNLIISKTIHISPLITRLQI
jgi:hypothetical protein